MYITTSSGGNLTVGIQFISPYYNSIIGVCALVYTFVKHVTAFPFIYGLFVQFSCVLIFFAASAFVLSSTSVYRFAVVEMDE